MMDKSLSKLKQGTDKNYHEHLDLQTLEEKQQCNQFIQLPVFIQHCISSSYYRILIDRQNFYRKSEWATNIKQNCIDTDFQSINIQLHYGPYATKITVIYLDIVYKEESDSFINSGSFGRVQACVSDDRPVAVKLIKLNQNKQFSSEIEKVYQQYFIALMASQLKVGPQLINVFGYQIVFFKNYALFGMELCENLNNQKLIQTYKIADVEKSLKHSLDILHSLHVVHRDIKPENIMWSSSFQKLVFIDFGLSQIVKERPGEKTLTPYVGSYSYCSPEMQKCFVLQKSRHIDLYENDIFGLEQSIKNIFLEKIIKIDYFTINNTKNEFFDCLIEICFLKIHCFQRNFQNAYNNLLNIKYALKTCLEISNIIKQKENFYYQKMLLWDKSRNLIKKKILQKNFVTSSSEQIFQKVIQRNSKNSFSYLLPFSSVLEIQPRNLKKLIKDEKWLSRIYFIFNPNIKNSEYYSQQKIEQMTNKIYSFLQQKPTPILMKKIRRVLLFFYQKFSELKNKQILQSLSDLFIVIGDTLNATKIRNFILNIIQDPLEYYLKNLLYYVLNYQYSVYSQGFSINTLKSMKKINQQISQCYPEIAEVVQRFCREFYTFQMLQEVLKLLDQLQKKIQKNNPEFTHIIARTNIRYLAVYVNQINIQTYEWYSNKKKNSMMVRGKQFIYSKVRYEPFLCCVSLQLDHQFYVQKKKDQYSKFYQTQNEELIKQYVNFYFQVNQNKRRLSETQFLHILQKKFKTDLQIIKIVLKERLKWVQKYEIFYTPDPKTEIYYIFDSICSNIEALCKRTDKNNESQRKQSLQLINYSLKILQARLNMSIENQYEKKFLLIFINVISLARIDYEGCEQEILEKGKQLYQELKSYINIQYLRNRFLSILVNIYRKKYFKKQAYVMKLEELIFSVFQIQPHFDSFVICSEEIIGISRKFMFLTTFGYNFMIQFANYLNCLDKNPHFLKQPFNKAVCYFVEQYSSEQVSQMLTQLDSEKPDTFIQATEQKHGCYLIFKMLEKCHKQSKLLQKYLFKIAICLSRYYDETRKQIMETYFTFFIRLHKEKKRKLLICQRMETRYNFLKKKMKHTRRKVQRREKNYPQNISFKLMAKLNNIFI